MPDGVTSTSLSISSQAVSISSTRTSCLVLESVITGLPILVTEHGCDLDTPHDARRAQFITDSLRDLGAAIADGLDVRGYIHWCLADNFEWFKGYNGNYGLMSVDRTTQRRTLRPSAIILGQIASANAID